MMNRKSIINKIISVSALLMLVFLLFFGCKKEEANKLPWVTIVSPLQSIQIESGDSLAILAEAGDEDGYISSLGFYINGELVLMDNEAPFQYYFNSIPRGDHNLHARAFDDKNGYADSKELQVSALYSDIVSIDVEMDNFWVVANQENIIKITASSPDCAIKKIEFEISGDLVAYTYDSVMIYTWVPDHTGNYSLRVKATDENERTGIYYKQSVTAYNPDPPSIDIDREYGSWHTEIPGYDLTINLDAESDDSEISLIKLYINDTVVANEINESTLSYTINELGSGSYTYYGVAYDSYGDSAVSYKYTQEVLSGIHIDAVISDITSSHQPDKIFALDGTNDKLLTINPLAQQLTGEYPLPEIDPIAFDYAPGDQKLYIISYYSGNVTVWDENTSTFESIFFSETEDGRAIEVDDIHRRIYVSSTDGLFILDMDSHSIILNAANINTTKMALDEEQQLLYVALYSSLYKYDVSEDIFSELQNRSIEGSGNKTLVLNPDRASIAIAVYGDLYIYRTDDINDVLGVIEMSTFGLTYNSIGSVMYAGEYDHIGHEDKIHAYSSDLFYNFKDYPIPNVDGNIKITTNSNDSYLVAFTYNDDYNTERLIYFFQQ